MTKYQYIYYSKVEQKWKMTEKAYESMPKFESIVDHIQKFVPEEMIDSAKSELDDYTPPVQNPDEDTCMKTFVAEDIMRDYTTGLLVVKANSFEDAVRLIKESKDIDSCYHGEIIGELKELEDNQIKYVHGGQ